ncbi:MAG: cytochrome C family [Geobacteraceae bacterium]|nr:MAG: cytochrome C family [Geobacteraceae bacterium]
MLKRCFAIIVPVILLYSTGIAGAELACYDCHGSKEPPDFRPVDSSYRNPVTGGFQGNHRTHMAKTTVQSSCAVCHPGSEAYTPDHMDRSIKVSSNINASPLQGRYRNTTSAFLQTPNAVPGTCASVNCHFERETPLWGSPSLTAPAGCSTCHGAPPLGADGGAEGSHGKHDQYYGGANGCSRCHPDHLSETNPFIHATSAGRRSLAIGLRKPDGAPAGSYAGQLNDYLPKSQSNQFGNCTNTYCHSSGTAVATGTIPPGSTPDWGSGALACTACHGYPPAYGNGGPKSNPHGRHNLYGFSCSRCHYATTNDGTTIGDTSKHVNQAYDITAPPGETLTYTFDPVGGSCTNTYCHSSAQGVTNPADPPVYATVRSDPSYSSGPNCSGCHKGGFRPWDTQVMSTGSHLKHLKFESGQVCNACHYFGRTNEACPQCHIGGYFSHPVQSARGSEHVNGEINVVFSPAWPALGAGGTYTGDATPGTPYGACQNIYCHSQGTRGSAPFETANVATVQWGGAPMPADCTGCHNGDAASSGPMGTGSHQKHIQFGCDYCHVSTVSGSRGIEPAPMQYPQYGGFYHMVVPIKHANGLVDVYFKNGSADLGNALYAGLRGKVPGTTPGRCTNTYCHSSGTSVATGTIFGVISSPVWGISGITCDGCHGYPPAYPDSTPKANSHAAHAANTCSVCHNGTTSDGTTIADQTLHANSRYDLAGGPGISFTYSYAATGGSCSGVSCHAAGSAPRTWAATPCGNCHAAVPGDPSHRRHFTGPAVAAAYGNASTSQRYLFNCGVCHPLDRAMDNDGTRQVELYNPATPSGSRKALNSGFSSYTGGPTVLTDERGLTYTNGSCSNIYCHSAGTSIASGQPAVSAPVTWNGPAMTCADCHANPPAYGNGTPKANSHSSHAVQDCRTCHSTVVGNGSTIADPIRHGDGVYDVAPGTGVGFSYGYDPAGGSCSAVSCHSDGTAVVTGTVQGTIAPLAWGAPAQSCSSCHGMPPAYPKASPKGNAHGKHTYYGCQYCHYAVTADGSSIADRTKHGNAQYDVTPSPATTFTYTFAAGGGSCDQTYCHSDGSTVATGGTPKNGFWPIPWNSTLTGCGNCHGIYEGGSHAAKANSHYGHWLSGSHAGCPGCHYAVTTDGSTIADPQLHINRQYDLVPGPGFTFSYTFAASGGSCSSVSCHHDGTLKATGTRVISPITAIWGTSMGCGVCHGNPPAYANGTPKKNSHLGSHAAFGCNRCHYSTTTTGTTIANYYYHSNGDYNPSPAPGTTFTYTFSVSGGTCGNASCHSDGTVLVTGTPRSSGPTSSWGGPLLGCTGCHAMPPSYANYSPKRNSHPGNHGSYGCQICHYATTTDGSTIADPARHQNNAYDVMPAPSTGFSYSWGGYCSNVICHGDGTAVVTGTSRSTVTVSWGSSLNCSSCHGNPPNYANGSPKANSHVKLWQTGIGCQYCHYSVTTNGASITTPSLHKNNLYNVTPAPGKCSFTYSLAGGIGSCASAYCHSNGVTVATGAAFSVAPVTWGGASLGCDGCHGNPPGYGNGTLKANSHQGGHTGYACNRCHYGYSSTHANGQYNVAGGYFDNFNYTFNSTGGTCNATVCHSDGTSVATGVVNGPKSVKWGGLTLGCTSCHESPPAYTDGSPKGNGHGHSGHTGYSCKVCHYSVTTDGATIADRTRHGNGAYDVAADGIVSFTYTYNAGGSSCRDVSCHADVAKSINWSLFAQTPQSFSPPDGSNNVQPAVPITVVFKEDMDGNTITGGTFSVMNGATAVAGTVSYDEATRTATFAPAQSLDYYNPYTVTLTSGVKNSAGGFLPRSYTWSFTTAKSAQFSWLVNQAFPGTWLSPFSSSYPSGGGGWMGIYPGINGSALGNMINGYAKVDEATKIDAQMFTPIINLSNYQSAELLFNYNYKMTSPSVAEVDVSLNGYSGPWTNVWRKTPIYPGENNSGYGSINLSTLAKGEANVVVRFRFTPQTPANTGWWAVDNVMVGGDPR